MNDMILRPEPDEDIRVNAYLDNMSQAPFILVGLLVLSLFTLFMVITILSMV